MSKVSNQIILLVYKNLLFIQLFLIFILACLSFYIRYDFWPLNRLLGLYQGDIWYFHHNYGQSIQNSFFFPLEYPVGYVILLKIKYFLTQTIFQNFSYESWVLVNALFMIPLIVGTSYLIYIIAKGIGKSKLALLYLLLSPTFFIAQSTNYDIYPTFFILLAIFLLYKEKVYFAFFSLAIGVVIKLYPLFLLPLFVLYVLSKKLQFKKIILSVFIFVITIVFINLPYFLESPKNWVFPYTWQSQNPQRYDPNTVSYYLQNVGLGEHRTTFLVVMIMVSWLMSYFVYQDKKLNFKNFLFLCLFTSFSAVFANHVNTPQYLLWFLPFLAILNIPPLLLWIPFDLINSSVLYFYFKIHYDYKWLVLPVFTTSVAYFLTLYIYFLLKIRKILNDKEYK